jgi:hypothetical protein
LSVVATALVAGPGWNFSAGMTGWPLRIAP